MHIFHTIAEVRAWRREQESVAFVPTMGNLHEGHLKLVAAAKQRAARVIVSIFVNRLQFGQGEDFNSYPRTFADDCEKLAAVGVDVLFAPGEKELYPEQQQYVVLPSVIEDLLEGEFRPGHFRGVATVVLKLFNIFQPDVAVFGKKDYQQLMVLRNMTRQLALPIEIIGGETVRAEDGLALSSRNGYLSAAERAEAPRLNRLLRGIRERIGSGARDYVQLEQAAMAELDANGWKTDYVAIRRQTDLLAPQDENQALVVLAASRLGKTRLIDNVEI